MKCDRCNRCDECACPKPVLEVSRKDSNSLTLRFNVNGLTTEYDFSDLLKAGQTDTLLSVDIAKRVLKLIAERHIDTLTAQEIGSILHLTDLGDVTTKGAENGATLVYNKAQNCPEGCVSTRSAWQPWNALDNIRANADYVSVFDADGMPITLGRPSNANQFYNLGWHGNGKLSFSQPSIATEKRAGDYTLYMRSDTKEVYAAP